MSTVHTWFERDRAHVELRGDNDVTLLEFWDEEVGELVELGLLDPGDWESSMREYADHLGIMC